MSDWERPGSMQRALEHWARAAAAIDAIVLGTGSVAKPAVTKGVPLSDAWGDRNAPGPALEADQNLSERNEMVDGAGVPSTVDSEPRAPGFGRHEFRWKESQTHGPLNERLQGRKGERCRLVAQSLVRKPLDPTPGLWAGKRPEPGVHSVQLLFEDGYQVVTSMWAIRKVAS